MGDDLKNLGKRGWLNNITKPKDSAPVDTNVVTRYAAAPQTDVGELQKLVERDPSNVELKDMLAFTLYSQERIDEALALFKDLVTRQHRPDYQRLYAGNCYYKKKLYHLAVQEWDSILRMPGADPSLQEKARARIDKVKAGVAIDFG